MKSKATQASRASALSQRGMTLIEIMVVIAILGILATALGVAVTGYLKRSKIKTAQLQLNQIANAVTAYYADEGDYPSSLDELTKGAAPYLKEKNLKDPWKTEIIYRYPAQRGNGDFDLCSAGPDKKDGTEDDICRSE